MSDPSTSKPKIDRSKYIIENQQDQTIYKHFNDVSGANFKIRKNFLAPSLYDNRNYFLCVTEKDEYTFDINSHFIISSYSKC